MKTDLGICIVLWLGGALIGGAMGYSMGTDREVPIPQPYTYTIKIEYPAPACTPVATGEKEQP